MKTIANTLTKLSFLDLDSVPEGVLSEAIKDEVRIAILHGVDITKFAEKFKNDEERVHYIRLIMQYSDVTADEKILTLPSEILKVISDCLIHNYEYKQNLSLYVDDNYNLKLDSDKVVKILEAGKMNPGVRDYDFNDVPSDSIEPLLLAYQYDSNISDLYEFSKESSSDVVKLLVNLRRVNMDIEPFLDGLWTSEQVYAMISGKSIVSTNELLSVYNITDAFSAAQIREIIDAISFSPTLAKFLASCDKDFIPLFNNFQMYEIIEGERLGLDTAKYASPSTSQEDMRVIREKLMDEKEKESGKIFRSRLIRHDDVSIDDDLLNSTYYEHKR